MQELSTAGLSLVFTEKNLVDLVWEDHGRPDPPNEGLMVLDIAFTGCTLCPCLSENIFGCNVVILTAENSFLFLKAKEVEL